MNENEKKNPRPKLAPLHVHCVSKAETVKAINGLDLEVYPGETLGLVGETGAGKTTTGLTILNMVPKPQGRIVEGKVTLDEMDILSKSESEMSDIRGDVVSMIFQDPMTSLNPVITVGDRRGLPPPPEDRQERGAGAGGGDAGDGGDPAGARQ